MGEPGKLVETSNVNGVALVRFPAGVSLDESNAEEFGQELMRLPATSSDILLNFANVHFMSSGPLGKLMALHKSLSFSSGKVKFCCLRPEIRMVLQVTQFDKLFEIYDSQEDGLASF